ncbi:MAG: SBBP repeat-containing protein [Neisseriaceae bacterium]
MLASNISIDQNGNSYITGSTNVGLSGNSQHGILDYFITKYDKSGKLLWTKQFGKNGGSAIGTGISVEKNSANIYVSGSTKVGLLGEYQHGKDDYFIAKYNKTGDLLWFKQYGESGGTTYGTSISVDQNGNSYITGFTNIGLSGNSQHGNKDCFIAKYNKIGKLLWIRQFGKDSGYTIGMSTDTDYNGNIYVSGSTTVGLSGETQHGKKDYFIAKYSKSGTLLWAKQDGETGGYTSGLSSDISVDQEGNNYVTGETTVGLSGNIQYGPIDYFIAKHSSSGKLLSTKQDGESRIIISGKNINIDSNGNSYVTACFATDLKDEFQQSKTMCIIRKYDKSGNALWNMPLWPIETNKYGGGRTVLKTKIDKNGNIYVTGITDSGFLYELLKKQPPVTENYFIAKYDHSGKLLWHKQSNDNK